MVILPKWNSFFEYVIGVLKLKDLSTQITTIIDFLIDTNILHDFIDYYIICSSLSE